jgi:hypothetical protein
MLPDTKKEHPEAKTKIKFPFSPESPVGALKKLATCWRGFFTPKSACPTGQFCDNRSFGSPGEETNGYEFRPRNPNTS